MENVAKKKTFVFSDCEFATSKIRFNSKKPWYSQNLN